MWTSPKGARVQVANLGAGLAAAAPDAASSINAATASYLEDIDSLDQWTAEAIETVPAGQRVLFTSHDAFGYFSRDYGIRFIGAALSDFNEQQDATADHIAKAVEAVKTAAAKTNTRKGRGSHLRRLDHPQRARRNTGVGRHRPGPA